MIRWAPLAFLLLPAAQCAPTVPDHERFGLTEADLKEPPSPHRMKAAVLNDVRNFLKLDQRLDEGQPACPAVVYEGSTARCALDQAELEVYSLRGDPSDEPYRVDETAYFCRAESVYYYHYVGGSRRRNVWMGPYKLERKRPKKEDE